MEWSLCLSASFYVFCDKPKMQVMIPIKKYSGKSLISMTSFSFSEVIVSEIIILMYEQMTSANHSSMCLQVHLGPMLIR